MEDWETCDLGSIDEDAFPITCGRCDYSLRGLEDTGVCPECARPFDRRQRLWELHGPEAFVESPSQAFLHGGRGFWLALLHVLAVVGSLPFAMLAWASVFGSTNICFIPVVWFVVITMVEYRLAQRRG